MNKKKDAYFISCDWGTSMLRLRLADLVSLEVIGEVANENGIAAVFDRFNTIPGHPDRVNYYAKALLDPIKLLGKRTGKDLKDLPLICSGMASSSMGICEMPYSGLPFNLDGSNARMAKFKPDPLENPLYLISGLKSDSDVMRGEETEVTGLHFLLADPPVEYVAIIPGTHSKHITVNRHQIIGFNTFMTGELFKVLSNSSTLGHSVQAGGKTDWGAFCQGIDEATRVSLPRALFKVRTNELLGRMDKCMNYAFLSGLLIGAELAARADTGAVPMILLGNSTLNPLYNVAISHMGLASQLLAVPDWIGSKAVLKGQAEIFDNLKSTL